MAALATSACASVDTAPPLFASSDLPVTLTEFRIRLNDLTEYFVAIIDQASEDVIDGTDDQVLRRNAMEFRLRATTRFLNSLNQVDPVASMVDAWAFCLQLDDYVRPGGVGAELFGDYQQSIIDAAEAAVAEAERVVAAVAQRPTPNAEILVHQWADENPFRTTMMVRGSTAVLLAEQLESQDNSAFAALGRLQAGVDDIVAQYQRYVSVMPRMIRWQSQLILHETLYDELQMNLSLQRVDLLIQFVEQFSSLLDEMPEDIKSELMNTIADFDPIFEEQKALLIAQVDRQRELVFVGVDAERAAIMADIQSQVDAIEANVQAQIDDVFARLELLTNTTVEESFVETERIINLLYLRALTLVLIGMVGGAGLILLHKWRHPMRRAKASGKGGSSFDDLS